MARRAGLVHALGVLLALGTVIPAGAARARVRTRRARHVRHVHTPRPVARAGGVSDDYQRHVDQWHAPVRTPASHRGFAIPPITFRTIHGGRSLTVAPLTRQGGWSLVDLARARETLAEGRSGYQHDVEPRLLDTIYAIARHFGVPVVNVVSCVRPPRGGSHSRHFVGAAMDIALPGVSDDEVAAYARTLGFLGVGVYPVSGFVHVDVRDASYFWIDESGPGQSNRARPIQSRLAAEADRRARARGMRPAFVPAGWVEQPESPLTAPDAPDVYPPQPIADDPFESETASLDLEPADPAAVDAPETPDVTTAPDPTLVASEPASAARPLDAAEEPIAEPAVMPAVPARLRWRAHHRPRRSRPHR